MKKIQNEAVALFRSIPVILALALVCGGSGCPLNRTFVPPSTGAAFKPRDGGIAFVSSCPSKIIHGTGIGPDGEFVGMDIHYLDLGKGEVSRLTHGPRGSENTAPTYSPDGAKIAFVSNRDGHDEVYVMNSDGSNEIRLTRSLSWSMSPSFSPTGNEIVYVSSGDIYITDLDGAEVKRVTSGGGYGHPTWGRDSIVFLAGGASSAQLYSYIPNTGTIQKFASLPSGSNVRYPRWNLNYQTLAFNIIGDQRYVYTSNPHAEISRIPLEEPSALMPDISSDGRFVAYDSVASGEHRVEIATVDGSYRGLIGSSLQCNRVDGSLTYVWHQQGKRGHP